MSPAGAGKGAVDKLRPHLLSLVALFRPTDNKATYQKADAIEVIASNLELSPPERAVLEALGPWLAGKRVLDVGVGMGRTTVHLAPLVASYTGVDYSPPMVQACTQRLGPQFANASFSVADVRDSSSFGPGSFDFVLFSFNGLDNIGDQDRRRGLAEMRRVTATGGRFCFSSHNLVSLPAVFRLNPDQRASLYRRLRGSARLVVMRLLNGRPQALLRGGYAMVRDGSLNFRVTQYYVRPSEQLDQLRAAGFSPLAIYGLDGRAVALDGADEARDAWLYYLAGVDAGP